MKKEIYAVYDLIAEEMCGPLLMLPNDAAARRMFSDAVAAEGTPMHGRPEDYVVYHIGTMDVVTGSIEMASSAPFQVGREVVTGQMVRDLMVERAKDRMRLPEDS